MSALAGILEKNPAKSVDRHTLSILEESLYHLGPDNSCALQEGRVGLVYRAFHTTTESHKETQPYRSRGLLVTFDGRIDNRQELCTVLKCQEDITDVELFSEAYLAWEGGVFAKLLGDFAVAVWDQRLGRLVFARDPFGIRNLFYVVDSERIVWSSDIGSLLRCPGVSPELDETFVGLSLALLPDGRSTGFKHILPVGAGHVVTVEKSGLKSRPFWGIEDCLKPHHMNQEEIQAEFLRLLEKSISVVSRSDRTVTAELSGGLDSSTIVCMASALQSRRKTKLAGLDTLSFVYDNARNADERSFIAIVEQHIGKIGSHLIEDEDPILSRWPDSDFISFPNRLHCFGGAVDAVHNDMKSRNSRVLLSGEFGDQLFVSSHLLPYSAADLIGEARLAEAFRVCHAWSLSKRQPLVPILWHAGLRPHLPMWLRRAQPFTGRGPRRSPVHFKMPAWIAPDFIKRTKLDARIMFLMNEDARYRAGSRGIRFANMRQCVGWFTSGYTANQTSKASIEVRYPYSYRPLVEFLISLPYSQMCNDKSARYLQRSSLRGVLPEAIRLRTDKKGPHQAIMLAVKREWPTILEMIDASIACDLGFVSKPALIAEAHGWFSGQSISDLLKFVALERWLQALRSATLLERYK